MGRSMYCLSLVLSIGLAGCGGGTNNHSGNAPDTRNIPPAGLYDFEIRPINTTPDAGVLFVTASGYVLYSSVLSIGHGTWTVAQNGNAVTSMQLYGRHGLPALGPTMSPGSGPPLNPALARNFEVAKSGAYWSGGQLLIWAPANQSAPTLSTFQGTWTEHGTITFCMGDSTCNVDYQVSLTINADGVFTGSDSNQCQFAGQMQKPTNNVYPLEINTSGCMDTDRFISNDSFSGFAYYLLAPDNHPNVLSFSAINVGTGHGIVLSLVHK